MNLGLQLSEILQDLSAVKVESTLILGSIVLLIVGLIRSSSPTIKWTYALVLLVAIFFNYKSLDTGVYLSDAIWVDEITKRFSVLFLLTALLLLVFQRSKEHVAEFYFLVISLLVGSLFIMKANSFLILYLSVELTSIAAYILTNFVFKKEGYESGIKYLLFGALSSAIMLFGFGLIYGTTQSFYLTDWSTELFEGQFASLGLLFVLFGLFFKASIVPFHIWVPGTYQSAPSDATALFSVVPKLASLVLIGRVASILGPWDELLSIGLVLGIITVAFGTLAALKQVNARRMISIGAIAHSGFLLPLVLLNSESTVQAFWFYSFIYAIMNVSAFYLLDFFERRGVVNNEDYSGVGQLTLTISVAFTFVLVSLVGLPPMAGFTAKFMLFTSLWEQFLATDNWLIMIYLVTAVFATVLSLFFYFRIPYYLFLMKPKVVRSIETTFLAKIVATLFSIVLLLLFFAPELVTVMKELLISQSVP